MYWHKTLWFEKIKTSGDSYMAACGLPMPNVKHAIIYAW